MRCCFCGKEIEDNSQFCGICGKQQEPSASRGRTDVAPKTVPVPPSGQNRSRSMPVMETDHRPAASGGARNPSRQMPPMSQTGGSRTGGSSAQAPVRRTGSGAYASRPNRPAPRRGNYARKQKSPLVPILIGVIVVLLAVLLLLGFFALRSGMGAEEDCIETVQKGYLGSYKEATVQEFFDSYFGAVGYAPGEWISGESAEGRQIVELRYAELDEALPAIRVQFWVLDDGCFRINNMNDHTLENTKASDLYCIVNYAYYSQYLLSHRQIVGDRPKELGFISTLENTPCYVFRYGAPGDYTGDRNRLYEKFGDTPLEISSALLLDQYGLLDLSDYYPDPAAETTEPTQIPEVTVPVTTPPVEIPETTAPPQPTYPTQPREPDDPTIETELDCYVKRDTGGLNVRREPSASAMLVGSLNAGQRITVYELKLVGATYWGRIDDNQWVCMSYVSFSDDEVPDEWSPGGDVPFVGQVKDCPAGLVLRSGPGMRYELIGKLDNGTMVTVYETRLVEAVYWGRVGNGKWVSLEYIDPRD